MSQKSKHVSLVLSLVGGAIKGLIVSIILVLGLALLLKFVEIKDGMITILDQIIKIVSIFVAVKSVLKHHSAKTILVAFLVGAIYTALTFILFSALKGCYVFNIGVLVDILLGGVIGAIFAVILNIFSREKIRV